MDELYSMILKGDILTDDERAQINAMKKSYLEKYIKEHHKNAISHYNSGKYITYTTRVPGGKKISAQSIDALYEKLYDLYSGTTKKDSCTIENLFDEALDWHSEETTNKTKIRNRQIYNRRIRGNPIEKKKIVELTRQDILRFLKGFKDKTTKTELLNVKSIINFVLEYACELDVIPINIALGIRIDRRFKTLPEKNVGQSAYSQEEAREIVSFIKDSDNVYDEALQLLFYTALRFSEIADLKWEDYSDGRLIITHAMTESGNVKTGAKGVRDVYLCKEAYNLVERLKLKRSASKWIFPNQRGNRMQNNHLNERLKNVCSELGILYRPTHKIRAYAITEISITDIESARKIAGQTNYQTTLRYVNERINETNIKAYESLNLGVQTNSDQLKDRKKAQ